MIKLPERIVGRVTRCLYIPGTITKEVTGEYSTENKKKTDDETQEPMSSTEDDIEFAGYRIPI